MGEDLGGIAYDEAAALYPGAVFPEGARDEFLSTEVLLVEKDSEELEDLMEGQDARELEALAISHRISRLSLCPLHIIYDLFLLFVYLFPIGRLRSFLLKKL